MLSAGEALFNIAFVFPPACGIFFRMKTASSRQSQQESGQCKERIKVAAIQCEMAHNDKQANLATMTPS